MRTLLMALFVSVGVCSQPCLSRAAEQVSPDSTIKDVFVDVANLRHDAASNGDTWDYIWADDGNIYSFGCDGRGYGNKGRNLNFNVLSGGAWNSLTGSSVSPMDYGRAGEKCPNQSNWKVTGGDCIDGVIYAFVANNWYGNQNAFGGEKPDPRIRQTVLNMSLIKSTDHGKTWSRDSLTNRDHPMWTTPKFSTGFFFKYGQNGGSTNRDDADRYVYAISNDGYWNCGTALYLGRVPRSKIGDLNATDWEYRADGRWTSTIGDATPLPGFPTGLAQCTSGSPIWVPALQQYVTVTWYDPGGMKKWYYPENVTFSFYQADHPWGPWSWCGEKSCNDFIGDTKKLIHRWYGPSLSDRFLKTNEDGSVSATLTFSGQEWEDKPTGFYKNNCCPLILSTRSLPKEVTSYNDSAATYSNRWTLESNRGVGDFHDDAHVTRVSGESAVFSFQGSGIEALSEKYSDMGSVEVILDGVSQGTFDLHQDPMPRLYQIEFFRAMNLSNVPHKLQIINKSPDGTVCLIDGFRVYGAMEFDPHADYNISNRVTGASLGHSKKWRIERDLNGTYSISNLGNPLRPEERWAIKPVGNGTFSITNAKSGLLLTGDAEQSKESYFGRDIQKWSISRGD
jgi:hypothetical protein